MEGKNNDAYFEQQVVKQFAALPEEALAQRISDCQMVVDKLSSDPVWKLVLGDATQWIKQLDANWQDIKDDKQLNSARVLKYAYLHLATLTKKYGDDLERAKAELARRNNIGTEVIRDYDLDKPTESL